MNNLNIEFLENYKRLDGLLKDAFSSQEGISAYISEMEKLSERFFYSVSCWQNVYKQLKRIRWLRNKLAHEMGTLNSDLCTINEIEWIKNFYESVIKGNDPLTIANKKSQFKPQERTVRQTQQYNIPNQSKINEKKKESLWTRIKRWFLK